MALLEVVALTAADAEAAEAGGADRIEVIAEPHTGGPPPDPKVAAMRRATALPIRVMLRAEARVVCAARTPRRPNGMSRIRFSVNPCGFMW